MTPSDKSYSIPLAVTQQCVELEPSGGSYDNARFWVPWRRVDGIVYHPGSLGRRDGFYVTTDTGQAYRMAGQG